MNAMSGEKYCFNLSWRQAIWISLTNGSLKALCRTRNNSSFICFDIVNGWLLYLCTHVLCDFQQFFVSFKYDVVTVLVIKASSYSPYPTRLMTINIKSQPFYRLFLEAEYHLSFINARRVPSNASTTGYQKGCNLAGSRSIPLPRLWVWTFTDVTSNRPWHMEWSLACEANRQGQKKCRNTGGEQSKVIFTPSCSS